MRFVTFEHGGKVRAGVLAPGGVNDLAHCAMQPALSGMPADVASFVQGGLDRVAIAIAGHGLRDEACLPMVAVKLLAPIARPCRIFGIAHNFHCALAERAMPLPKEPVLFMKQPATIVGPGDAIVLPLGIGGVTYEAELAAVIGRGGNDIAEADALSHVAGYAAFNDISASDMIRRDGRFDRGKNLPTFGPLGPWLATADEVPDPQAVRISLTMDGKLLQDGTTARMLFGVAQLIAYLSRSTRLEPGDIIATGTPAGAASARKPPTWILPGATLKVSVDGLGTLTNPVVEGPPLDG